MKVVFVAPYTLSMSIGGFEIQVYHIFKGLKELGIDVCWHNYISNEIADADILQIMATDPSMISMIKRAKNMGVKVVLTPMQGSRAKSNNYLKIALALSKVPQLCSLHKATSEIIRSADYITPLCTFEANRMHEVYGISLKKIKVIPNGLNQKLLDESVIKKELPFKNYILIVGRIEENKNQINLIKACNELGKKLLIVGEPGPEASEYLNACKNISGSNIYYWGLEKNVYVLKYLYQNAALTAIPSYSEMVPLVAFESLSQKTPVLCTNRCGIAGDVIPGLFYCDVIKEALKKVIPIAINFDRNMISEQGIYSWVDIAKQYLSVYEYLLK